ncbi:MAG: chaperone NapD [Candidatus Dactylopiibacterium sp.]|nr:chaperone NapD [Candidatus Dactylopiibacterium sp.]
MRIASLLVRVRPEHVASTTQAIACIAGASLHGLTPDGSRLVVLVEDGEGYAVADSILAVSTAPGVLGTTLAYEYGDDDITPADLAGAFARSRAKQTQEETRT